MQLRSKNTGKKQNRVFLIDPTVPFITKPRLYCRGKGYMSGWESLPFLASVYSPVCGSITQVVNMKKPCVLGCTIKKNKVNKKVRLFSEQKKVVNPPEN